ncbi:heterokaryon incompatibility protein-domain-containing protein [Xylaria cf. heliscus]|nr:heterokaryon incompatibility protein-domain-containing protein [Xylaria cf. heliscus]
MKRKLFSSLRGPEPCFRLVLLQPGDALSDIHCQLSVSSLDHPPHFEALSYVWGDANDRLPITIEGQTHNVTKNLHSALQYLRYPDRVRTLWIDALCINQEDNKERNHQVRLMGRIYSTANHVVAWLGHADHEDEDLIIRLIEGFGGDPKLHWTELFAGVNLVSFFSFLRNPWWDRVWTAQEAMLARDLTFQYGHRSIPRATMMGMLNSFHVHLSSCCVSLIKSWVDNRATVPGASGLLWIAELQLETEIFRVGIYGRSFCQGVTYFRHRDATNPRDKVYGLLGIVNDAENISIDYDLPIEMVYEKSTREIITSSGKLDILVHLTIPLRTEKSPGDKSSIMKLPSWVPDWNSGFNTVVHPSFGTALRLRTLHLFKACGPHLFKPLNGDKKGSLRLKGVVFDTVEKISLSAVNVSKNEVVWVIRKDGISIVEGNNPRITSDNMRKYLLMKVIQEWRNMAGIETEPERPYPSGGTIMDAFWRTLCLDISSKRRKSESGSELVRAVPEDQRVHDHFWLLSLLSLYDRPKSDKLVDNPQNQLEGNTIGNNILEVFLGRWLFFTKKGYLGLAPDGVKVGDMVCVLAGGHFPFILRRAEAAGGDKPKAEAAFTMIGDAYVHGIMDGEAIKKVDEGSEKFQTFKLI